MKRRWLITMLLSLAVGVAACGDDPVEDDNNTNNVNNEMDAGGDADPDADEDAGDAEPTPDADDAGDTNDANDATDAPDAEDPSAALTAEDQFLAASSSDTVTVAAAESDGVGWVVIHADDGGSPGDILGQSSLADGANADVVVPLDRDVADGETLHAMLHIESDPDADPITFDAAEDTPVTDDDGPITDSFTVTLPAVEAGDLTLDDLSTVLTVSSVRSKGTGWIVIHEDADGSPAAVIGHAAVADGENADVEVVLDRPAQDDATLWAMLHLDDPQDDAYTFDATNNADEDVPASLAQSGDMIMDSFNVQIQGDIPAVRITIGAAGDQDYTFENVEPLAHAAALGLGGIDSQDFDDPAITFNEGWRYEIVNTVPTAHPFELVEEGGTIGGDTVLFSQAEDGSAEGNTDVNWVEDGDNVRFTVTGGPFTGGGVLNASVDAYRCQLHPANMRGTVNVDTQ